MNLISVHNDARFCCVVLTLSGRLSGITCAGELGDLLNSSVSGGCPRAVLDLSDVAEMDFAALGVVLALARQAREAGGWVRVVSPNAQAHGSVELIGPIATFTTVRAALRADVPRGARRFQAMRALLARSPQTLQPASGRPVVSFLW